MKQYTKLTKDLIGKTITGMYCDGSELILCFDDKFIHIENDYDSSSFTERWLCEGIELFEYGLEAGVITEDEIESLKLEIKVREDARSLEWQKEQVSRELEQLKRLQLKYPNFK
jgi:hypothetical protein